MTDKVWELAEEFGMELDRANEKHGVYAMEPLTLHDGMLAVVEEVGETAQALHEHRLTGKHGAREELVQLGSLAMAMIMKIDRGDRLA